MNVLVIDDEPVIRRSIENTLREGGYTAISAQDGWQGLALLKPFKCQLIITDWMMPGMNGIDFRKAVRGGDNPHDVYIIMVTARDRPVDTISGLNAGADDYVINPFHPGELLMRVNTGRRIIGMESREMTSFTLAKLAESRDPEWISREMISYTLHQEDFICDVAEDRAETYALLAVNSYNVVVTDLQMSGTNQGELVRDLLTLNDPPLVIVHASIIELKNSGMNSPMMGILKAEEGLLFPGDIPSSTGFNTSLDHKPPRFQAIALILVLFSLICLSVEAPLSLGREHRLRVQSFALLCPVRYAEQIGSIRIPPNFPPQILRYWSVFPMMSVRLLAAFGLCLFLLVGCSEDKPADTKTADTKAEDKKADTETKSAETNEKQDQKPEDNPQPEEQPKAELKPDNEQAIAAIKEMNGRVAIDPETERVFAVDLRRVIYPNKEKPDSEEMTELMANLQELPYLRMVYATGPEVTDNALKGLEGAEHLEFLELLQASVGDEGMKHLSGIKTLKTLRLQKTNVTSPGLEAIKGLTNITYLDLRSTNVDDAGLAALKDWTNLTEILFETSLYVTNEGLKNLTGNKGLKRLVVIGTQWDDQTLEIASQFPELRGLVIDASNISEQGLEKITNLKDLQELSIRYCYSVGDGAMEHIGKLKNLKNLKLRGTAVTNEGMKHIQDHELQLLTLEETAVGDEGIAYLKDMTSLQKLYLWLTQITDEGMSHLANLTNLEELTLRETPISDEGFKHIENLTKLRKLDLSNTKITDKSLEMLQNFKNLEELQLEFVVDVSNEAIEKFQAAVPACKVTR